MTRLCPGRGITFAFYESVASPCLSIRRLWNDIFLNKGMAATLFDASVRLHLKSSRWQTRAFNLDVSHAEDVIKTSCCGFFLPLLAFPVIHVRLEVLRSRLALQHIREQCGDVGGSVQMHISQLLAMIDAIDAHALVASYASHAIFSVHGNSLSVRFSAVTLDCGQVLSYVRHTSYLQEPPCGA